MPPLAHARAFAVHIFTAAGAALALAALVCAVRGQWAAMFLCSRRRARRRRRRRNARALAQSGRAAPALVRRRARPRGRFCHLRVRPRLRDCRRRFAAGAAGAAGRHCRRHDRRALFRRPEDEDRGQLLSRFSGAVERGRVLSFPVQARALVCRGLCRRARGADLRAVQIRPSDAGRAAASRDHRRLGALVPARPDGHHAQSRSRTMGRRRHWRQPAYISSALGSPKSAE